MMVPPPHLQQDMQSPYRSHLQHTGVSSHGQIGHQVVTPSQVTWPRSPMSQLRSTAEQELLPEQPIVLLSQLAVAVQADS